jgi:hypothetical protein
VNKKQNMALDYHSLSATLMLLLLLCYYCCGQLSTCCARCAGQRLLDFTPALLAGTVCCLHLLQPCSDKKLLLTWSCRWLAGCTCLSSCFTASAAALSRTTALQTCHV